jgi:hypothetical protein
MEASQNFEEVPVFTGEAEVLPDNNMLQAIPQVPMLRSQTQYHTAVSVQKPRKLDKVVEAVLREAEFAGEAFYYSFPMGGKKVEGASIGLAMAVAREWTNCAVPVEYQETLTEWVFNAHFVDLEKGFTVSRVFRQKKGKGRFKKLDDDRAEDMTFQAAQSRAIRNVVLAGVPRWLVDQAKERAKDAVIRGITKEGLAAATDRALKFLAGYGISEARVIAVMEKPKTDWISEDIAQLRGMASQLKDGQATPEKLFPPIEEPEKPSEPKKATRGKKPAASKAAVESISGKPIPSTGTSPEVPTADTTQSQGPDVDELLGRLDPAKWSLEKLQATFGKKKDQWGPDELSRLADLAAKEA